jgi:hypothetical protein
MTSLSSPSPHTGELRADVALALALADHGRPRGEVASVLRRRMCCHIRELLPGARSYAATVAGGAARATVDRTVAESAVLAEAGERAGPDAAQSLRLLAKAVDTLARYCAAARHRPVERAVR